jgi:hypothetical protein
VRCCLKKTFKIKVNWPFQTEVSFYLFAIDELLVWGFSQFQVLWIWLLFKCKRIVIQGCSRRRNGNAYDWEEGHTPEFTGSLNVMSWMIFTTEGFPGNVLFAMFSTEMTFRQCHLCVRKKKPMKIYQREKFLRASNLIEILY